MVFFQNVKVGDTVKWYDPAWRDLETRDDILLHLNTLRTVTDVRSGRTILEPDDIVELDNGTEVYAVELVNPKQMFVFDGLDLKITKA